MASIRLSGLVKTFGDQTVIPSLDLAIEDREFVVFVGPSGCGKSTLLRIIAGLESVDAGDVMIGDRRVNDLPPARRDIAMVFQDYALYPHMTVYANMAFGLEMRDTPRAEIDRRVRHAAGLLRIEDYLQRKPKALSGGQRQRVAMGRAMVREPQVFLFDEPLSNLDAKLRGEVRTEIKALSQQLQTTMIFVTHDQVEAMTMADRIVVLKGGVIQQVGTPQQVYRQPANRFVASFIGSPPMNFLAARPVPEGLRFADGTTLPLPTARREAIRVSTREATRVATRENIGAGSAPAPADAASVTVGVRPEHLRLGPPGGPGIATAVTVVEPLGSDTLVYFLLDGERRVARVAPDRDPRPGDAVTVSFDPEQAHLFTADEGRVIA